MNLRKLDILLLKSYVMPMLGTFFIVLFIQLMQFIWKYVDDLVGKGLDMAIFAQLLFYISATFVPMALPLGMLLATLMTFGNLGESYELVALKAAGIGLKRIMRPLMFLSAGLAVFAFFFTNTVMPRANLKAMTLLHDVRSQKPAVNIKEGVFYTEIEGYAIKVGEKEKDGKTIRRVLIYDHTKRSGNANLTIARSGRMEITPDKRYLVFTLFDGVNYYEKSETRETIDTRPMQRTRFSEQYRRIDLSSFAFEKTNEEMFKDHHYMLNIGQLDRSLDSISAEINLRLDVFNTYVASCYGNMQNLDSFVVLNPAPPPVNTDEFEIIPDTLVTTIPTRIGIIGSLRPPKETETVEIKIAVEDQPLRADNYNSQDFLLNFSPQRQRLIAESAVSQVQNVMTTADMTNMDFINRIRNFRKHEVELHRKFVLSLACLLFFFIGAPLGAIIRKGGLGLPVLVSVIFFVFYYAISMTGEKMVKESIWSVWAGMWFSSAVLLPMGIFLTIKATSDSPLLESDAWSKFFKKLYKRREGKA